MKVIWCDLCQMYHEAPPCKPLKEKKPERLIKQRPPKDKEADKDKED